jgi:transposase
MISSVVDVLSRRLVPDELWALAAPLIPGFGARPQGGGTAPVDDRAVWTKAGLWRRLHHAVLDELGSQGLIDWSRAVLDGASVRAKKGDF